MDHGSRKEGPQAWDAGCPFVSAGQPEKHASILGPGHCSLDWRINFTSNDH